MSLTLSFDLASPIYPYGTITPVVGEAKYPRPDGKFREARELTRSDSLAFRHTFDLEAFARVIQEVRDLPEAERKWGLWITGSWSDVPPFDWCDLVAIYGVLLDALPRDVVSAAGYVAPQPDHWSGKVEDPWCGIARKLVEELRHLVQGYNVMCKSLGRVDSGGMQMQLTYFPPDGPAWAVVKDEASHIEYLANSRHKVWAEGVQIAWAI